MISFQTTLFAVGLFLIALALAMVAPGLVDWFYDDINWRAFAKATPITLFVGMLLTFANRPSRENKTFSIRDAFLLTGSSWIILSLFAALPFIFSNSTTSHTDSFFEAISGLTTTGASVMRGIDYASPGIVLWRAILQWLGGVGIVAMALTVMPMLHIGGMQLFRSEFSDRSEKILPKVSQITKAIFAIYIAFAVICAILLLLCGVSPLEAVCHALTTVSTGGYSTSRISVAYFDSIAVECVIMFFMVLGGITLILFVRFFKGDYRVFLKDSQTKVFLLATAGVVLGLTFWRWYQGVSFGQSLRETSFNVISIMTTTGFSTTDYTLWGSLPLMAFFIMMQVGACTGSTSGSIKIFRFQIMLAIVKSQIAKIRRPHGIFIPRYNGKQIPEDIFASVFTFFGLYVLSLGALTLGLGMFDLDFLTSLSGAVSALNNIGPGVGPIIGPDGSFAPLPVGAKWLLMLGMLVGRLEYLTIFILLTPRFWRD
tara:strand:- start:412 stop:1863 length:1452 start_codon:yes stop_codon:yes gene_type:complete